MKEKEERTVSGNWKGTLGSGKKWYQVLNPEVYFNEFAALQNKRKRSYKSDSLTVRVAGVGWRGRWESGSI